MVEQFDWVIVSCDDSGNDNIESQKGTGELITASDADFLLVSGFIAIGGTAGTAQFQWAQNSAATQNTEIEEGSILVANRIT